MIIVMEKDTESILVEEITSQLGEFSFYKSDIFQIIYTPEADVSEEQLHSLPWVIGII